MNILVSSTWNWNPGDEFIRMGIEGMLRSCSVEIMNFIPYNRNPDLFECYPKNMIPCEGTIGNYFNHDIPWDYIDMVVLAGSPEWLHQPLLPIYDGLYNNPDIPLLALGVGYSFEKINALTNVEKEVLSRENTTIISRQYNIKERLEPILKRDIHVLPCPATFVSARSRLRVSIGEKLCIFQKAGKGNQLISYDLFGYVSDRFLEDKWLGYYKNELFNSDYYATNPNEIIDIMDFHSEIHTTRLHAAIVGQTLGKPTYLYADEKDYRIHSAIEPFPMLNITHDGNIVIYQLKPTIERWRADLLSRYNNILRDKI